MSTNKVYGDTPNERPLRETPTRYDYARPEDEDGIDETCRIDRSLHCLFGARRLPPILCPGVRPVLRSEGWHFSWRLPDGPAHSGVELHGFLSYLVKVALPEAATRSSATRASRFATTFTVTTWYGRSRSSPNPRPARSTTWEGGGAMPPLRELLDRVGQASGRAIPTLYEPCARVGDHIVYITNRGETPVPLP